MEKISVFIYFTSISSVIDMAKNYFIITEHIKRSVVKNK